MSKLISVFGGTGHQGGSVIKELLNNNYKVKTFTRDINSEKSKELKKLGVEVLQFDISNSSKEDIENLLSDSYGVYLVTSTLSYADKETEYGIKVVDAALCAGVKHLVFSTLPNAKEISKEKYPVREFDNKAEIEKHCRQISKENKEFITSFVAAPYYYQNFKDYDQIIKIRNGEHVNYSFDLAAKPDIKLDFGDINQIGVIVTEQFKNPKKYSGLVVPLSAEKLTCNQICEIFSKHTGKNVSYKYIPTSEYRKNTNSREMEDMADMYDYLNEFPYLSIYDTSLTKKITKLTKLKDYLKKSNYNLN